MGQPFLPNPDTVLEGKERTSRPDVVKFYFLPRSTGGLPTKFYTELEIGVGLSSTKGSSEENRRRDNLESSRDPKGTEDWSDKDQGRSVWGKGERNY